tara:strand:- start:250 stop:567 length:318 start_codon:yes stop_codon:yes gene_type:complete
MHDISVRLVPINRHVLVVPHFSKNENESKVLLPDDFELSKDRYIEATVIDVAEDCTSPIKRLRYGSLDPNKIVIDSSMLEEVILKDKTHYMILENYIVALYRRPE